MNNTRVIITILLAGTLAACGTTERRYLFTDDSAPAKETVPDLEHIEDAQPRVEPLSKGGNRNYKLGGNHYEVWQGIDHYSEVGNASWYGKKFHGHKTSNGEVYDMYSMTAAHKNLPLPSYVRVTNLNNDKSVTVRVNDRGPFHGHRIIDLSYAAAYKLGMIDSGTSAVRVELVIPQSEQAPQTASQPLGLDTPALVTTQNTESALPVDAPLTQAASTTNSTAETVGEIAPLNPIHLVHPAPSINVVAPSSTQTPIATARPVAKEHYFIQVLAAQSGAAIAKHQARLSHQGFKTQVLIERGLQKLRVGPFDHYEQAINARNRLHQNSYNDAYIIKISSKP
jgi:rare lipoprotein A (peptidoglycan hydrolase)